MAFNNFHDRDGFIWVDGELKEWRQSTVHILSHALHYASSVFEGIRCYNDKVFKLTEHNARLIRSAELLNFPIIWSVEELNEIVHKTIEANGFKDCYIRPLIWRGSEQMGLATPSDKIHLAVAVWEWPSMYSMEKKLAGVRLAISKWKRPSPETAPSAAKAAGLYMICTLSKDQATRDGFDDALMYDYRGYVAEATGANIFLEKDGVLHTPTPDCFLNGITRLTVIELAKKRGIEVVERHIMPAELGDFSSAFLTGTAAEITPISEIDGTHYVNGEIIPLLLDDFKKLTQG